MCQLNACAFLETEKASSIPLAYDFETASFPDPASSEFSAWLEASKPTLFCPTQSWVYRHLQVAWLVTLVLASKLFPSCLNSKDSTSKPPLQPLLLYFTFLFSLGFQPMG